MRIFPCRRPVNIPPPPKPGGRGGWPRRVSFRAISWAALATALAGCDGNGSVMHSAHLEAKPDMLCMQQALKRVPGVSQVHYLHAEGKDRQSFDEIDYQADEQHIMLMVQPDRSYRQLFLRMGAGHGGTLTARVRRVMTRVDVTLARDCHLPRLARDVRETCGDGTHPEGACPPLAP